jgi:hypothetical protein
MISEAAKFGGEAVVPDKSEPATCVMWKESCSREIEPVAWTTVECLADWAREASSLLFFSSKKITCNFYSPKNDCHIGTVSLAQSVRRRDLIVNLLFYPDPPLKILGYGTLRQVVTIFYPDPWYFFITRIIAASSDIILLRLLNHIINLNYVIIITRSIRM